MLRTSKKSVSVVGVLGFLVFGGGVLMSTSAGADPAQAQAPVDHPICKANAAVTCRQFCEHPSDSASGGRSCDELGRMYRDGTPGVAGGVGPANIAEAVRWFVQSCSNYGWPAGCTDLAGALLIGGDSTQEPNARGWYEGTCKTYAANRVHEACYALGEMCESGRGGPKDLPAAKVAYQKACDGGDPRGCPAAKRVDPRSHSTPTPPQPPGSPTSIPVPPKAPKLPPAGGTGRVAPVR